MDFIQMFFLYNKLDVLDKKHQNKKELKTKCVFY